MMYILTQEEFDDLQEKSRRIAEDAHEILQELCTRIADKEVLTSGWAAGYPWGCIISKNNEYCDLCPVQDICPCEDKEWSQ